MGLTADRANNASGFLLNDKILDALSWIALDQDIMANENLISETRFFVLEGTIRSAKTVTAIMGFAKRVKKRLNPFAGQR